MVGIGGNRSWRRTGRKTHRTRSWHVESISASRKGERTLIVALLGEPVRNHLWVDAKKLLDKGYEMLDKADSNIKARHTGMSNYTSKKS